MDRFSKYIIYGPAIGLILGSIIGLAYGIVTNGRISTDLLYGAAIGACAGWGFRNDYEKKHKK